MLRLKLSAANGSKKAKNPSFKKKPSFPTVKGGLVSYCKHRISSMTKCHDSVISQSSRVRSLLFFLKVCKSPKFKIWHLQSVNNSPHRIQMLHVSSWQLNQISRKTQISKLK